MGLSWERGVQTSITDREPSRQVLTANEYAAMLAIWPHKMQTAIKPQNRAM